MRISNPVNDVSNWSQGFNVKCAREINCNEMWQNAVTAKQVRITRSLNKIELIQKHGCIFRSLVSFLVSRVSDNNYLRIYGAINRNDKLQILVVANQVRIFNKSSMIQKASSYFSFKSVFWFKYIFKIFINYK